VTLRKASPIALINVPSSRALADRRDCFTFDHIGSIGE
jgi:hypothetical protein